MGKGRERMGVDAGRSAGRLQPVLPVYPVIIVAPYLTTACCRRARGEVQARCSVG